MVEDSLGAVRLSRTAVRLPDRAFIGRGPGRNISGSGDPIGRELAQDTLRRIRMPRHTGACVCSRVIESCFIDIIRI